MEPRHPVKGRVRGKIQRLALITGDPVTLGPELGAAGDVTEWEDSRAVEPGFGEGS